MFEKESIPFAPMLIESMRSIGYSFESAIADIIDNKDGTCIIKGKKNLSNNYITLYAKDEDEILIAEKNISIMR